MRRISIWCGAFASTPPFLFHDIPLSALHLQPGETTEARWVSKAGLEALVASGEVAQPDVRRLRQLRDEFRKIWNA